MLQEPNMFPRTKNWITNFVNVTSVVRQTKRVYIWIPVITISYIIFYDFIAQSRTLLTFFVFITHMCISVLSNQSRDFWLRNTSTKGKGNRFSWKSFASCLISPSFPKQFIRFVCKKAGKLLYRVWYSRNQIYIFSIIISIW